MTNQRNQPGPALKRACPCGRSCPGGGDSEQAGSAIRTSGLPQPYAVKQPSSDGAYTFSGSERQPVPIIGETLPKAETPVGLLTLAVTPVQAAALAKLIQVQVAAYAETDDNLAADGPLNDNPEFLAAEPFTGADLDLLAPLLETLETLHAPAEHFPKPVIDAAPCLD